MFFKSNMYPCKVKVELDGNIYEFKCAESAYQACKCPERFKEFIELDGYEAKKLGKKVQLRPDWEELKYGFMYVIVKAKFEQNRFLKIRLMALKNILLLY